MARVRWRVVGAGVAAGLIVLGGGAAWLWHVRTPEQVFRDQWDRNVAATAPLIYQAIQADPALRSLMLDKSAAAFARGGWPAANNVFYRIVAARITTLAGDDTILACSAGWRDVYAALVTAPKLCRLLDAQGTEALPKNVAVEAVGRKMSACAAAIEEGVRLRLSPNPPEAMTAAEAEAVYAHAMDAPRPLTPAQRAALQDQAPADDAAYCSAKVALADNIAALPKAEAARYARQTYASEDDGTFAYAPAAPLFPGDAPADLRCAPAGTRFTLSMNARATGLPIMWESLGRKGWDCQIRSTVSGEHGMWANGADDRQNALRLLWPLAAGKRAGSFRVADYGPYWTPFGTVDAYAIEQTFGGSDGMPDYRVTNYWAPALGFEIGRHTQVVRGGWPDDVGPDWQVVAMAAAPPTANEARSVPQPGLK